MSKLKSIFITLGLACGMTAGALAYMHNVPNCRVMVLKDMQAHAQFVVSMTDYTGTQDFLTTLSRGK